MDKEINCDSINLIKYFAYMHGLHVEENAE